MTINTVNASSNQELVIALMGKGGTGKTFTSLGLIQSLRKLDKAMIVADADTNRSLSRYLAGYYLGYGEEELKQLPQITLAEQDFYEFQQLDSKRLYRDFYGTPFDRVKNFSVEPPDSFTQKYIKSLDEKLALMSVGTSALRKEELYSNRCSHATLNPLKAWLALSTNGIILADCGGGEDVGRFGLPIGAHVVVVVVEATPDAIAISEDIRAIDEELGIPVVYVLNKCLNQFPEVEAFEKEHQDTIVGKIPFIPTIYGKNPLEVFNEIEPIFNPIVEKILSQKLSSPQQRWERVLRWQKRLQQQMEIKKSQSFSVVS